MKKENIVLTLDDDKDYVLVNKITFEGNNYVYLMDINNNSNFMFAKMKDNVIEKVTEESLLIKLITIFANKNK